MNDSKKIQDTIEILNKQIPDPRLGLPEEVFLFISRLTPMVNVDLLIKDKKGLALLSWRDDLYAGTGWHLPGGIIRFRENIESRILKVAETESGTAIEFDPAPIAINQVFCNHETRGHFISLLIRCSISGNFIPENKGLTKTDAGYLMWHDSCPENIIHVHEMYRDYL